jgi:DHA1 family tetracycline resistance protein-like MFS transporter
MRSITFIIGPWLFLRIFGWFVDPKNRVHLPGAPYFLAGGLLFSAMLMATRGEKPQIQPVSADAVPDVVPPEGMPSAAIAPILDSEENV